MKKTLFLVTLVLAAFSCSEERFGEESANPAQSTLSAERPGFTEATLDGPELRTNLEIDNNWKVSWVPDDIIGFRKVSDNQFATNGFIKYKYGSNDEFAANGSSSLSGNKPFYAFYPAKSLTKESITTIAVTFNLPTDQIQNGTDYNEHFADYDFMYSDAYYYNAESLSGNFVKFSHGVAFFDVILSVKDDFNGGDVKLYEVELVATDNSDGDDANKIFPTQIIATINSEDALDISYEEKTDTVSLHIHEGDNGAIGATINAGEKFQALFIVGEIEAQKTFDVKFRTNKGVYYKTYTVNARGIEAGKYYKVHRTIGEPNHLEDGTHNQAAHKKTHPDGGPFRIEDKKTIYIYTAEDLNWLSEGITNKNADWTIVLAAENITADAFASIPAKFTGTFEGHGHKITGLTKPLFATLNGTVKDLNLADVAIDETESTIGAVAGTNKGTILNVSVSGSITGTSTIGGIVGNNQGSITNCSNAAEVTGGGKNVGGIVGNNKGSITDCSNAADVTGDGNNVGGIIGTNSIDEINVFRCNNTAIISGANNVGGIIGSHTGNGDACAIIKSNDCSSSGKIISPGKDKKKGNLIGNLECNN